MVATLTEMFKVLSFFFMNNRFNEWEKRKSDAFHTIYEKHIERLLECRHSKVIRG